MSRCAPGLDEDVLPCPAAVLVPAYTVALTECSAWFEVTDRGWAALLGGLMFWNAAKFAALGVTSVGLLVRACAQALRSSSSLAYREALAGKRVEVIDTTESRRPARDLAGVAP